MKLAIAHYSELLPWEDPTASSRYRDLGQVALAAGHDVVFVTPSFRHRQRAYAVPPAAEGLAPCVRTILVPTASYARSIGAGRTRFLRDFAKGAHEAMEAERPDVALVGVPPPGAMLRIAAAVPRERLVADVRDLWPDAQVAAVPERWQRPARALSAIVHRRFLAALARAAHITTISETYADIILERAGRQAAVLPLGVPVHLDRPDPARRDEARRRLGCRDDETVAVFLGSLSAHFDFRGLLHAVDQFQGRVRLLIAGRGTLRPIDSSGGRRTSLLGWVEGADRSALLAAADVGVAPYNSNASMSLPNKPFEYAAAGLPTLHTGSPELTHLIERYGAGLKVASPSSSDWQAALSKVLYSESCASMSVGARRLAIDYDRKAISCRFLSMLENMNEKA